MADLMMLHQQPDDTGVGVVHWIEILLAAARVAAWGNEIDRVDVSSAFHCTEPTHLFSLVHADGIFPV